MRNTPHPQTTFRDNVRDIVRKIPVGSTLSYKDVATRAGNSKAARAVGAILHTNFDPSIPCHRVIKSDGTLGGYNRGSIQKKLILEKEKKQKSSTQ